MRGNPDIAKHGFKKGQSGNPNGRPKKLPHLDELLADVLSEESEEDGMDAAKAILVALRNKAMKGDIRAAEVLFDRAYGKAKQFIEQNNLFDEKAIKNLKVEFIDGSK